MAGTTIQKLVYLIENSLADLQTPCSQEFIEATAILIHEAMSASNRRFHTTDHVFQILDPNQDPILLLSALFHDLVYYNVDGGFTKRVEEIVSPYILIDEKHQISVQNKDSTQDKTLSLVLDVFGFKYGQVLAPLTGLNEFLSALVFARLFYPILSPKHLLAIIVCLEASQPFRKDLCEEGGCFAELEDRLKSLNESQKLGFADVDIVEMVLQGVRFSNLDIGNFAYEDAATFLDNTWKLLPENNPHLNANKVYTIRDYRTALEKMEAFFTKLDVSSVFHRYRGEPSNEVYNKLRAQAEKNVGLAKNYLAGRLLAMGILEGLCMLSGGDAPVVMLMGNISRENAQSKATFNQLINRAKVELANDIHPEVLALLEYEADLVSILDFRKTPLTAFIYKCVGHQGMLDELAKAKDFFAGRISADQFLAQINQYVVSTIAAVCAEMISTRKERFLAIANAKKKKGSAA